MSVAVEEGNELSYGVMDFFFPLASLSCFRFYLVSISEMSSLRNCELICTQRTWIYNGGIASIVTPLKGALIDKFSLPIRTV